ncbi:MAG: MFS transporter [Calditrichaeota bacterium]|nr:MAG: MFS transporter [Calditrichota bacterium]
MNRVKVATASILRQKSVWAWSLYDVANSAFVTTVVAGFFPIFFKSYWSDPADPVRSTFYLGLSNSLASILVAFVAPFLGALADGWGARKRLLALFAYLGVVMNLGLVFVHQGHWLLALLFYVLAVVGFSGSNIFYDALLSFVAPSGRRDLVSAFGYALGYLGGGLVFLLNVLMYQFPGWFYLSSPIMAVKYSFVVVSVWWAAFTVPLLLWVSETPVVGTQPVTRLFSDSLRELYHTFRNIRVYRQAWLFLLAYWFYIDGVDTIIRMAVDYGKSIGFSNQTLITALLMVQFIAFPFALIYGWLGERIGTKRALVLGIVGYMVITIFGYFMHSELQFYALALLVSMFQGGLQALSRSFYSRLVPREKSAEFFGFYNMLGKFAVVLGPVLLGTVARVTGNIRLGILSIIFLFLIGLVLLLQVAEPEGDTAPKG